MKFLEEQHITSWLGLNSPALHWKAQQQSKCTDKLRAVSVLLLANAPNLVLLLLIKIQERDKQLRIDPVHSSLTIIQHRTWSFNCLHLQSWSLCLSLLNEARTVINTGLVQHTGARLYKYRGLPNKQVHSCLIYYCLNTTGRRRDSQREETLTICIYVTFTGPQVEQLVGISS